MRGRALREHLRSLQQAVVRHVPCVSRALPPLSAERQQTAPAASSWKSQTSWLHTRRRRIQRPACRETCQSACAPVRHACCRRPGSLASRQQCHGDASCVSDEDAAADGAPEAANCDARAFRNICLATGVAVVRCSLRSLHLALAKPCQILIGKAAAQVLDVHVALHDNLRRRIGHAFEWMVSACLKDVRVFVLEVFKHLDICSFVRKLHEVSSPNAWPAFPAPRLRLPALVLLKLHMKTSKATAALAFRSAPEQAQMVIQPNCLNTLPSHSTLSNNAKKHGCWRLKLCHNLRNTKKLAVSAGQRPLEARLCAFVKVVLNEPVFCRTAASTPRLES